jgi:hypothetical protein
MIGIEFRRIALAQGCLPTPLPAETGEQPQARPYRPDPAQPGLTLRRGVAASRHDGDSPDEDLYQDSMR